MSNRSGYTFNFSSSVSYSSSTNGHGTTHRVTESVTSNNRDGTTIRRSQEETGRPRIQEERHYAPGSRISGRVTNDDTATQGRIQDITDQDDVEEEKAQKERDREYEERMEDEYAKREGGA
ncbi:hypothetical protein LTR10_019853 [Elasticomyces elasticus]|uniref:Hypervirulence associated protein TUDOR domain-containing protein n=1 Tax=Exophiala sideris TaxID=1016849 RepID=A0ABR0J1P4_9EURO|nr:hypothetical protein LTR10_019853 [Elasticomyces elasticus]KAK5024437.1 hypothetical protein LTS07_008728 [Exophiala sideris]KAK5030881.1 hypothetical protein LTR13_007894 [Exophiala sideris]KAK5054170.1 hypothetical protein LTR69_009132 [Exophiala sideris]KAK5179474.1 hypothetical protein LTR44_007990 [Eurotiomycetes sp. CCFEE 6388]